MPTLKTILRDIVAAVVTIAGAILAEHYFGIGTAWTVVIIGGLILLWLHEVHVPIIARLVSFWNLHFAISIAALVSIPVLVVALGWFIFFRSHNGITPEAPLEIVAFRSGYRISIANNGPLPVYVTSLVVKTKYAGESKSFGVGLNIDSGKVSEAKMPNDLKFTNVGTSKKLADTWEKQVEKAIEIYAKCGMQFMYFSPSDPSLQQIKNAQSLADDDISGVLYYHVQGLNKEQIVPIVVVIVYGKDAC